MSIIRNSEGFPVLTYHSIDDSDSVISVSVATFDKHMRFLRDKGYITISLIEAINYIKRDAELPQEGIVITFDDGYQNNYKEAFPILQEYGYTATIFLTTGHSGKTNNWSSQHLSIPELSMLSWEEIREMSRHGIEFGAHTQNHVNLEEVSIDIARKEIIESKDDIQMRIDRPVELFSYPFGCFNKEVQDITRTAFRGAISNNPGKINYRSDIYALERINATGQIFKSLPINILYLGSFNFYLMLKKYFDKYFSKKSL